MSDDALLERILGGWETAELGPRREAMLRYVSKLTRTPAEMQREDVAALRAAGFEDEDILGICECTAYYAYANRIVDGLGVPVEDWLPEG